MSSSLLDTHTVEIHIPIGGLLTHAAGRALLLLLVSGGGRRPLDHGWNEMGVKVWDEDDVLPPEAQEEEMRVKRERNQIRSAVGADRWTVGALPGIKLHEGVPPTYPRGASSWDVKDSWRDGSPCGRRSDNRGRWGHGPAHGVAVGLEPRAEAGSELWEGASVGPGQQLFGWVYWRRSGHEHFVGCLRPDDLPNHPTT